MKRVVKTAASETILWTWATAGRPFKLNLWMVRIMTQALVERREYSRLAVDTAADLVRPDGVRHAGRVRDISFAGAHLDCAAASDPPVGNTLRGCVLSLHISGRTRPVQLRCMMVDRQGERVGLRFTGAEEGDYAALREFLLSQSADPEALIREIRDMPNPVFASPLPRFATWLSQLLRRS